MFIHIHFNSCFPPIQYRYLPLSTSSSALLGISLKQVSINGADWSSTCTWLAEEQRSGVNGSHPSIRLVQFTTEFRSGPSKWYLQVGVCIQLAAGPRGEQVRRDFNHPLFWRFWLVQFARKNPFVGNEPAYMSRIRIQPPSFPASCILLVWHPTAFVQRLPLRGPLTSWHHRPHGPHRPHHRRHHSGLENVVEFSGFSVPGIFASQESDHKRVIERFTFLY